MRVSAVLLQNVLRDTARNQAGQIDPPEKLFLIGLLGQQPLKLSCAGNVLAEQVDGIALGLAGVTQNKQVLSGQQRNGDQLNEFRPLSYGRVHISDHRHHLFAQRHAAPPVA